MKKNKIIYWTTTLLFSIAMFMTAFAYLTSPDMKANFFHLGFPDYFRLELAIAKFLGVLALALPFVPKSIKEFAYHGFAIVLVSAVVAHGTVDGTFETVFMPFVFLAVLIASYIYYKKIR